MIRPKAKSRARLERIVPRHIVEVWRLVEASIRDGNQPYPDTTEDSSDIICSHIFQYLQLPTFTGVIARIGKRPVGVILGDVRARAYGRPSKYGFVWCFWVDPKFRDQAIGHSLFEEYSKILKQAGIYNFEAEATDSLVKSLEKEGGISVNRLLVKIGGRV